MKIDIQKIANLGRLDLTADEKFRFEAELESIIEHMSMLGEVDTSNVSPTFQVTGLVDVTREDQVSRSSLQNIQTELIQSSKYTEGNLIKLPSVF